MRAFNITFDEHERRLVMKALEEVIRDGESSPRKLGTMDLLRRFERCKEGWLPSDESTFKRTSGPPGDDTNQKPDR